MKLIFVYNANSGNLNALLDATHKILSPQTYECDLCSLTFGAFREKEEWVRFRESIKSPLIFLHKDEFLKAYKSKWLPKYDFPIVLAERNGELEIAIATERFKEIQNLEALIDEVNNVLKLDWD
ncbi:GTPase [Dokdonia sinensis]|uniref:GTPase n=1 Tax=Dokdonia sinensis TaxID=2479847 RepID=A0A3M0GD81_9FLAO|nr:GTPase [Dokdonia sinensis]RMB62744.1 GTPase [Dokdonia sinensis]